MNLTRIKRLLVNLCLLLILGLSLANGQTSCQMNPVPNVRGSDAQYDAKLPTGDESVCQFFCVSSGTCLSTEYRGSACLFSTKIVDLVYSPGDYVLFKRCPTTTAPPTTTPQPQTCPNSMDTFPDPYSCQHYRICVFDMLFRAECDTGLSYDADQKLCVQNSTTPCATVTLPGTSPRPAY